LKNLMPIRVLKIAEEYPPRVVEIPYPAKVVPEVKYPATVEWFRTFAPWYQLLDRSTKEGRDKLLTLIREEFKITDFDETMVPCIVELEEGKSIPEKQRIKRAIKVMAKAYSGLIDRLVRYRLESRSYAYESFRDDLKQAEPLWFPYECDRFRGVKKGGRANKG